MGVLTDKVNVLGGLVEQARLEAAKCENDNKAAGTRIRALMQDAKATAQAIREEVLRLRDGGKAKK